MGARSGASGRWSKVISKENCQSPQAQPAREEILALHFSSGLACSLTKHLHGRPVAAEQSPAHRCPPLLGGLMFYFFIIQNYLR